MANQEHIYQLKRNVNEWNRWRDEHVDIKPDLSGVNLSEVNPSGNLSGANLSGVNLSGATFSGVDLSSANLIDAILSGANLNRAILSYADLSGANLSRATLKEATLEETTLKGVMLNNATLSDATLTTANLSGANLSGAKLVNTDLTDANLSGAILINADLNGAILRGANLRRAILTDHSNAHLDEGNPSRTTLINATLSHANLSGANLSGANLSGANLSGADFSHADLNGADLTGTSLVRTNLKHAFLTNCLVYGIAAWDVQLEGAKQLDLVITVAEQPQITVDNLKVAQFIYLLLNNEEIRDVIDTITSKVVLILGRFTPERKVFLDAIRNELRKKDRLPVLFDFDKPASRDLTETVSTLAHLARYIIVDLTDPSSAPQEVATIIPQTIVPIQPLLTLQPLIVDGRAVERREYAMFDDLRRRYHWVLPTFRYQDIADLLASLQGKIIGPAEQKLKELLSTGYHKYFPSLTGRTREDRLRVGGERKCAVPIPVIPLT